MNHRRYKTLKAAFLIAAFFTMGCATYQSKVHIAREHLENRQAPAAVKALEPLAKKSGKDQLVYLLDYATALQQAERYDESNKAFIKADELAEVKDYHSISKITASVLFAEENVQYKGEDYERIFINAMAAINFLMLGNFESAQVETRRLNEKMNYYRTEAKRNYDNAFAHYVSAMIWEQDRKWDDAYIDYERAYKIDPNIPYLEQDLLRLAAKSQRWGKYNKWKKEFDIKPRPEWNNKNFGELVLVYQQGWGPRKGPNPNSPRFPQLFARKAWTRSLQLNIEGGPQEESQLITDIDRLSIKTFNDLMGGLIAKRLASIAAKEVVADQVRQKDETLGALLRIGMHLSDRADVRQWSTLPQSFQVARVYLKAGTYSVSGKGLSLDGTETGENMPARQITVEPGKKHFLSWRSYR